MLDYPKALRAAGVAILCAVVGFLLILNLPGLVGYSNITFWLYSFVGIGAVLSIAALFRGLLKRKPHITYGSLHLFGAVVWFFLTLTLNIPWLLACALIGSVLLFVFLQPILTLLSKIQIVVHSAPKGTVHDAPGYEPMYQTMPQGEPFQQSDFGRYYPKE